MSRRHYGLRSNCRVRPGRGGAGRAQTSPSRALASGFDPVRLVVAATAAALLLAGCSASTGSGNGPTGEERYITGDGTVVSYVASERKPVPEFQGTTLDGKAFDSSSLKGKVAVVNVWGSWCPPCRAEAPALQRVHRATQDAGVEFVGLNVKDSPDPARAYVGRFGLTYPSIEDSSGQAQLALRGVMPGAIPSTIVVDAQGRLAASAFGGVTEVALRQMIADAGGPPAPTGAAS
ncbi:MAG: TlpA family protein disulfide reductase [Motilibacteraceae bacterium]